MPETDVNTTARRATLAHHASRMVAEQTTQPVHGADAESVLAAIAPRLARAYYAERNHIEAEAAYERFRRNKQLAAERLVAHRELQLQRSYWTQSPRYIAERQRKLAAARAELERWAK